MRYSAEVQEDKERTPQSKSQGGVTVRQSPNTVFSPFSVLSSEGHPGDNSLDSSFETEDIADGGRTPARTRLDASGDGGSFAALREDDMMEVGASLPSSAGDDDGFDFDVAASHSWLRRRPTGAAPHHL